MFIDFCNKSVVPLSERMASSSLSSEVYSRTNDYALNSGFVSSIDSSTEIENDEISPANFRHDLRKLLAYTKQDLEIYPLNLTSAGERNCFKSYLMERRIREMLRGCD
jgi:hypothetical protein